MNLKSPPADVASLNILDADHRQSLERALLRILHIDLAEDAYAEILDGMPMADTYSEFFYSSQTHPSSNHPDLCPGSREKAREFRASFDVTTLRFSLLTLLAFQDAEPGSKQFHLRLLELLAVSCHQIAVSLYELTAGRNHHHVEHENWRDGPPSIDPWDNYRPPIAFTHGPYQAVEQYPHGLADVAAYWAEARIFGGIMVFDRGETETECRELYMHSCLKSSTRTLFALTHEQFDHLIHFLLDDDCEVENGPGSSRLAHAPPLCPLPIVATLENRFRWDPWDAFARFHIFRDRYERKVAEVKPKLRQQRQRVSDWPELGDQMLLDHWDYERRQGGHVDQKVIENLERSLSMVTPSSPLWLGRYHYSGEQACEQTKNE